MCENSQVIYLSVEILIFEKQILHRRMNLIDISDNQSKEEVFQKVEDFLIESGFRISKVDQTRPWGGFFVLDESQIREFRDKFFKDVSLSEKQLEQKLSPKFLLVAPAARLSWQYQDRKSTRLNSSHVKISYAVFCL